MRKGQSVSEAARKLVDHRFRNDLPKILDPVFKEISDYIFTEIEGDTPEVLDNIQQLVSLIVEQAIEVGIIKVVLLRTGRVEIEVQFERLEEIAREIIGTIVYSPHVYGEGMEYFETLDIEKYSSKIKEIMHHFVEKLVSG